MAPGSRRHCNPAQQTIHIPVIDEVPIPQATEDVAPARQIGHQHTAMRRH